MLINNKYLSYYKMKEMEDMPKDNIKNKNILIEDEEPQDTKANDLSPKDNLGNKSTNDLALNVKNNTPPLSNDSNYFMISFYQNYLPNIVLLSALFILIIVEIIYKEALFKYSLTYEQNLQNSLSKFSLKFFEIISFTGNGFFIAIGLILIFCYFSLIKTIFICSGLILIVYLHDLMKLIHSDPRPFWIKTILFQDKCETSYGNPSGHSLVSFFSYLSFSYYLCQIDKIKSNNTYKLSIYLIAIFISSLTAFSRLALGVHSIDQVLYGSFLGIFAFLIFAFMFKIYDMPLIHYIKFFREKKYINRTILSFILFIIFPFILYFLIDVEKDKKQYDSNISKNCPGIEEYKLYSHNCLTESLIILVLCGIYFGQFIFWYLISKKKNQLIQDSPSDAFTLEESVNNWNIHLNNIRKNYITALKFFGVILIALIPGIFYIIIPGENNSLANILLFKYGLPLFFIGFLAFGPCLYGLIHILKE